MGNTLKHLWASVYSAIVFGAIVGILKGIRPLDGGNNGHRFTNLFGECFPDCRSKSMQYQLSYVVTFPFMRPDGQSELQ